MHNTFVFRTTADNDLFPVTCTIILSKQKLCFTNVSSFKASGPANTCRCTIPPLCFVMVITIQSFTIPSHCVVNHSASFWGLMTPPILQHGCSNWIFWLIFWDLLILETKSHATHTHTLPTLWNLCFFLLRRTRIILLKRLIIRLKIGWYAK